MISFPVWFVGCLVAVILALCVVVCLAVWLLSQAMRAAADLARAALDAQYTVSPPRPPVPPRPPAAVPPVSVPAVAVPPAAGTAPTRIDRRAASG